MAQQANKHQSDCSFTLGDWVYLKLQPYLQVSMRQKSIKKFSPMFYGPFKFVDKVVVTAYKLLFSSSTAIHDFFQVSQLKLCKHLPAVTSQSLHQIVDQPPLQEVPEAILDRKMVK